MADKKKVFRENTFRKKPQAVEAFCKSRKKTDISTTFLSLACDAWDSGFNLMEYFSVRKFATCISSCAERCSVMWSVLIKPFLFLQDQHCELASSRHHIEKELHALGFPLVSGKTWHPEHLWSPVILFSKILKMLEFLFKLNIAECHCL